jgi:hypothetical protein
MELGDGKRNGLGRLTLALGVTAWAVAVAAPSVSAAAKTKRVSVTTAGAQGFDDTNAVDISANGRFIVMASDAALTPPDTNSGIRDIYIHNRKTGSTKLISKSTAGVQGDGESEDPSISGSGRFVAFDSDSTNLIAAGTSGTQQVYLHDRKIGKTTLISKSRFGGEANDESKDPAISGDGRYVAFESNGTDLVRKATNGKRQIYVYDRKTGKMWLRSKNNKGKAGNDDSENAAISASGRFVAFESDASNLFPKDINGEKDVLLRDPKKGVTELISKNKGRRGNDNSDEPDISGDGSLVVYETDATNLVKPDKNGSSDDVLLKNRKTGKTTRVSLYPGGVQSRTEPPDTDGAESPAISRDGRYVTWDAGTTRMDKDSNGTDDIYRRDLVKKKTTRLSNTPSGKAGNDESDSPARLSGDGRWVVFTFDASDLVAGDSNDEDDAFIRGPLK